MQEREVLTLPVFITHIKREKTAMQPLTIFSIMEFRPLNRLQQKRGGKEGE
jgi:hypothetical protein